ncbi:MAG: hypothetical protein HYU66_03920 [Armatimonadetes bacterium]|nr:hypothetical protein [Armatimonadota bacterium]
MLFMVTQVHTPDKCPRDEGGSVVLYDAKAEGVTIRGIYGAYSQHVIYYLVEADRVEAVNKMLQPGFTRCTATVAPVSDQPLVP